MAEVIGLVASVASLVAFTSETSKACYKLAKTITNFKNATTDMQKIGLELLDLTQILELVESVLQPLQDGKVDLQGHLEVVERSLSRIKTGIQEIADVLVAVQPIASESITKSRAKWMFKRSDIASMMAIIDRKKQGLLLQFNILNAKLAQTTLTDLRDFRENLKQVVPRTEDLAACITTTNWESTSRFETVVQAAATSIQSSIKDEIHQTVLSIPRESNISQTSLQTLSVLVSNIVASRFESLESETSLKYSRSPSCNQIESVQRPPDEPQTEDVGTMTRVSHAILDDSRSQDSGNFDREEGSSRLKSRTSVQTMTSIFGKVVIRRSTVKIVYLNSDSETFSEEAKTEICFLPASWLRYWTGCGTFLARMGFGKPTVDISFTVARVLDFYSDSDTQNAFFAVITGDIRTLTGSLHRRVVYPTDRDLNGFSLLSIAAQFGQLEICELLLQQGASVDINTPSFGRITDSYPIKYAIDSSTKRNDHDLIRLFLKYDADLNIHPKGLRFATLPLTRDCAATHETKSLFRLLVDNDPEFNVNQREEWIDLPPILLASSQPLQIYMDLIRLGADVKTINTCADQTVFHSFFRNMSYVICLFPSIDTFLEGGEILALLIQAGADPLATDRFGVLPQDIRWEIVSSPFQSVHKQIFLAFWHQALRICDLSESSYCHCTAHNSEKMPRQDIKIRSPWRRRGFHRSLSYDTFEEEMSAALRSWDKSLVQRSDLGRASHRAWNQQCDRIDEWIQEVLIELQARQKKASSEGHLKASISVEGSSKRTKNNLSRSDKTQFSDQPNKKGSPFLTHGYDSDQDWETISSSSSNGEEEWESAPET